MSRIGRNDPCSCGSGKKYKKCCLHKEEQIKDISSHQEGLIKFALENYQPELAKRTSEHLAKHPVEKDQEQTFANIAVCWDVFCSPIQDGKTAAEHYIDSIQETVKPNVKSILQHWKSTVPSLYTIAEKQSENYFKLKDTWSGKEFSVSIHAPEKPNTDSVLLGALVPNGYHHEFYVGYVEMPKNELPPLKGAIEQISSPKNITAVFKERFPAVLQLALSDLSKTVGEKTINETDDSLHSSDIQDEKFTAVSELVKSHADNSVAEKAEELWEEYYTETKPSIRKEEVFAAALDYLVCKDIAGIQSTQAETAKKYGVSAASLSSRYRDMKDALQVTGS